MNRTIKFRGRFHREDGTWTSWSYVTPDDDEWQQFWVLSDRESIGQYVGWKDKKGQDVYTGDMVKGMVIGNKFENSDLLRNEPD